jgi:hypothetical protein
MNTNPILKQHPDGEWWTTENEYKSYRLMTKMRNGHGAKIHVFGSKGSVIKTFTFFFATPENMINKAIKWIDKI